MVEICPLALGVRLTAIRFLRPDWLENRARISSPERNHLRAVQSRGVSSKSYSRPNSAEYPVRPKVAESSRQACILIAGSDRQIIADGRVFGCNSFRIRTYEKMGVGVASPSPWENPHSAAKQRVINTYANVAAKYPRICTYEKNRGGGYPSPWFGYVA
jgi:hypothetical protein